MSMLGVRDVTAGYEDIQVLRGVSFDVNEGEIVALFGPNGHGKSTLLKVLSGVHPLTAGAVTFRGEDVARLPAHKIVARGLAYIPEERHLFPEMTVWENLHLGAYSRAARKDAARNLELVYEVFPRLKERADQPCLTLSGGESRMVAIARGLMSGASLLLVDEPSIGLAPGLKKTVYGAIDTINREGKITILLVEQEIEYGLRLAGRVYLMKKGTIQFERAASEVDVDEIKEAYF
jgi:branched-chain amino acid transport system ATP-binding protein